MTDTFVALGFAIFIWWFSTGIVILLNRMSRTAVTMSLVISSALGLGALAGLSHTAQQTGVMGAYCAFTCALLAWGWNELSFLTGWITGPQKKAILKSTTGWPRFCSVLQCGGVARVGHSPGGPGHCGHYVGCAQPSGYGHLFGLVGHAHQRQIELIFGG
jgi:hypothetical protein